MVHQESSSFLSRVSPQIPIILESSAAEATRRFRDSGVTVCGVANISAGLYNATKLRHRICVDGEDVFIKGRVNANHVAHLVIDFQFQR